MSLFLLSLLLSQHVSLFKNTTELEDMSSFLAIQSYSAETGLIVSQQEGGNSFIGRVYCATPLAGGGAEFSNLISAIFKSAPDDAVMQFSLLCTPDAFLHSRYQAGKTCGNGALGELTQAQSALFKSALEPGELLDLPGTNTLKLIISFNIPTSAVGNMSADTLDSTQLVVLNAEIQDEFLSGLKSSGFWDARALAPAEVITVYRTFHNIYAQNESNSEPHSEPHILDPNLPLNQQVFTSADILDFRDPKYMRMGEGIWGKAVSAKSLPEIVQDGLMNLIIGAPLNSGSVKEGGGLRIATPFIWSTTLRLAKQAKESKRIQRAISSRVNAKSIPKWLDFGAQNDSVIDDLRWIEQASSDGVNKYVFVSVTGFLFSKNKAQVDTASSNLKTTLNNLGFDARDVLINHGVRWAQALPLNFSAKIAHKLDNEALMPASSAACLLPIYGDYCGNANTAGANTGSVFLTRRGRAYYFDPFVSDTNKNGVIFAESGAGKSFVMQYMIANHLAEGTTVFLFDNGKSAKKTCLALGGEYIEFSIDRGRDTSINPFSGLSSLAFNEQCENICDLLIKMCYFHEPIQPGSRIAMNEAVKSAFAQKQDYTEIESVVEALSNIVENYEAGNGVEPESISAARNMRVRLNAFIKSATRGPFFKGQSNLNPRHAFTVIELSSLDGDPHLKQCILFFVMNTIMNRIKSRSGRKIIFLDEAWQILKDETATNAVEGFFRKIRKDNGSIWVVTQSLEDLVGNSCGEVIMSQSQWKLIMKQKPEVIDKNFKTGAISRFADDPFFVKSLKSISTVKGKYSEILIVGDTAYESVRLYVPRFASALFSSEGVERDWVFKLMSDGVSAVDAIHLVLADQKLDRRRWLNAIVYKLKLDEKISLIEFIEELKDAFAQVEPQNATFLESSAGKRVGINEADCEVRDESSDETRDQTRDQTRDESIVECIVENIDTSSNADSYLVTQVSYPLFENARAQESHTSAPVI